MSEWRRADLGDMPEQGQIITLVRFSGARGDMSVKVYERMRVEVIFTDPVRILGPGLPFEDGGRVELPERPEGSAGQDMILWRERG